MSEALGGDAEMEAVVRDVLAAFDGIPSPLAEKVRRVCAWSTGLMVRNDRQAEAIDRWVQIAQTLERQSGRSDAVLPGMAMVDLGTT